MDTLPKHLPFSLLLTLSMASSGLLAQTLSDRMDTVELDTLEIQSEYQFNDLQVELSQSELNENLLNIYGSSRLQDLSGLAPNLFTSHSDTRGFGDVLSMRGSANSLFFSPPSVALYIDDVPAGSVASYPGELLNIASVAILSGPQSTLYGRNASAGIIDIHTRLPGEEARRALQLEYGSYDSKVAKVLIDGPMSDTASYSASFGLSSREGYIDNTFLNRTEDDRESLNGRVNFYVNPNEGLQLRFGVFAETVDDGATRLSSLFSPDPYEVSSNIAGVTELDRFQLNFQLKKQLDQGQIISTTSYQDWDLNPSLTDLDFSPLDFGFSRVVQQEELLTQEIRFVSQPDQSSTQWTAGLFYFDSKVDGDATREFLVPPNEFVPPNFIQTERTQFDIDQQNIAAYANANTTLSDKAVLNFGVRIDQNKSSIRRTKDSSNNFNFPGPPEPAVDESQSQSQVAGTVGLTVAASDTVNFIIRSSLAHKPEGYSGFTSNPQFISFDSEKLLSHEIGINFTARDELISGSLVAFFNESDDYQYERTVPFSTDFVVVNAEEVSANGFEGKLVLNPIDRLFFDFQAGYSNAKFDKHLDSMGVDVSGKRVPFIPKYTVRTGVRCELENGFFGSASYTAFGKTYYDELNQNNFAQSAFGTWDAQVGFRQDSFAISVYGRNLSKETFYQFINPEIQAGSPGAPQRFGLRLDLIY
ncbi:MAG: TonB-dependent receptor [Verrucomicrobia bacterium]|nr:TonB-dependent receptor [Verrucomicrobiota bacterium]